MAWQEALLRVCECEPGVCEAVTALDAEYGLFGHRNDPRRGVAAMKRAMATERGRDALAEFGNALIAAQDEIARELR